VIALDKGRIPKHVGIIMDGNGRWAKQQGLSRTEGHKAGEESLYDTVEGAIDVGVRWLTVYAFSTENWKRSPDEVRFLMRYPQEVLFRRIDQLDKLGVRIRIAGRRDRRMPKDVVKDIEDTTERTKKNKKLNLVLAYNYGGRAEIVDAFKEVVKESANKIDEKIITSHLYIPEAPEPELIIRTSGEMRTSNFLIWQAAYAEWVFIEKPWPEFRRDDLFEAIAEYQKRERRFGSAE
jgi:undecaprenyl diphosphate synthase